MNFDEICNEAIKRIGDAVEKQESCNANQMKFTNAVDTEFFAALERGDDMREFAKQRVSFLFGDF